MAKCEKCGNEITPTVKVRLDGHIFEQRAQYSIGPDWAEHVGTCPVIEVEDENK